MNGGVIYLDSSAIVKLVVAEPESPPLQTFLAKWPDRISSCLARVELHRALRRSSAGPSLADRAEHILERLNLLRMDSAILQTAAALDPPSLRTLDAIHLATALAIGADLHALITYNARLADAAAAAKLSVFAPGLRQIR